MRRHFENLSGQMIDPAQQTASASDENSPADIIDERILLDSEHAALLYCAVDVENVIGRSAANIDHQRAQIFLMLGEHDLSGRQGTEDNVLHFKRQLFDAADGVLNPGSDAVDNVEISLHLLAKHPDRVEHAVLTVDVIMLND